MTSASDDAFHVLRTTRSVRRRLDFERPVEPEVLEQCIDAAVQAPTGLNREAWRFLVLTEPEPKQAVAELYRRSFSTLAEQWQQAPPPGWGDVEPPQERATYVGLAERLHEMPALVLVYSLGKPDSQDPAALLSYYGSVLPAAWSLMLALRARGLGTTWTTLLARESAAVAVALGVPEDVTQTVLLPVAWTRDATLRPAERKPAREVTYWNAWGQTR